MSAEPTPAEPPVEELPDLPPGEFEERIRLLDWAEEQIGTNGFDPPVGDYVLATDGRILGSGPNSHALYHRGSGPSPG